MALALRTSTRDKSVSSSIGTWGDVITQPVILRTFSPRDLLNRVTSTNLIARPALNFVQTRRTMVGVLSSKPGERPLDLIDAIRRGIENRIELNKARLERFKENWGLK